MQVVCPSCQGDGCLERDIWRKTAGGGDYNVTLSRTCEQCDGMGAVAALCSVCSEELDDAGDCPACQAYAVEYEQPYERPEAYVPSEDGALRVATQIPAKGSFTCELCGWTFSHDRTVMTVVSASRRAAHNLCAPCVRAIKAADEGKAKEGAR